MATLVDKGFDLAGSTVSPTWKKLKAICQDDHSSAQNKCAQLDDPGSNDGKDYYVNLKSYSHQTVWSRPVDFERPLIVPWPGDLDAEKLHAQCSCSDIADYGYECSCGDPAMINRGDRGGAAAGCCNLVAGNCEEYCVTYSKNPPSKQRRAKLQPHCDCADHTKLQPYGYKCGCGDPKT